MKDFLVGGKIDYIQRQNETEIRKHRMTPTETREYFEKAGWKTIVAFQTRKSTTCCTRNVTENCNNNT